MVLATTEIPGRRLKIFRVANEILISLFLDGATQSYKVVSCGLPRDAKIINVNMVEEKFIDYWIESEEFGRVPFGNEIPLMDAPVVARI